MLRHIHHINYIFIILLFVVSAGGSMAVAQQDADNQEQPLMTPVPGPSVPKGPTDSRKDLVDRLDLKIFEAAAGDLSLCADDQHCLDFVKEIKSWLCAADICEGTDKSKNPIDCFEGIADKYSKEVQDQINLSICPLSKSPSAEKRRALLIYLPDGREDYLVGFGAYLLALKESAASCENYIKGYVGPYGSQWNGEWYRAVSGCRILAHKRTRKQEEKDFSTWFGVAQGSGSCSDIVNSEMRKACSAPAAASPFL